MSEEVIKIFDYIGEKLGVAIDYTQENIYPYLEDLWHRYITFEIVKHSIGCAVAAIMLIIALFVVKKLYSYYKQALNGDVDGFFFCLSWREKPEMNDISIVLSIIACVMLIFSIIFMIYSLTSIIEWSLIPEKCIMEVLGIIKLN